METIAFLEALVRALGRGWSARYGMIAPYGIFGVTLTSDVGGAVEIVPALVRGVVTTWSPFVFTRGTPHYDLYVRDEADGDGRLFRTPALGEAVAHLERWRKARGPAGRVAARLARTRRPRRTEVETQPMIPLPVAPDDGTLADALADKKLGQIERARRIARQIEPGAAVRELLAIARRTTGDTRANALGVLVGVAGPGDDIGVELARYLSDSERPVQSAAIDAVKRIGYVPAVPALAAIVLGRDARPTSGKTRLAVSAATAMKVLSGKRGAAALTGYLGSADPRVREAACVAFTLFDNPGTKAARPLLEDLLDDRDPRVARAARRALATL